MPEFHSEPYLHLAGLSHKSALIAWGGFYFRVRHNDGDFKLVDDDDLDHIHPPRHESIGARSEPYGDAVVEVFDMAGQIVSSATTSAVNHCLIHNLEPDTEYDYRVTVNDEVWADGVRRDWVVQGDTKGLKQIGLEYRNRFRTMPSPSAELTGPFTFAIIGDFGRGVKNASNDERRQREVAAALADAVDRHNVRLLLTTGDNIYAQSKFLGIPIGDTGKEDDDWFFTFYQPYRYIINRIPVFPCIGNHDSSESEERDDRSQLFDNMYLSERLAADVASGRASIDPGLFYRFRCGADIEFVCVDTSKESAVFSKRLFQHPLHERFLQDAFPLRNGDSPKWLIPFQHHPAFCAGPRHKNEQDVIDHLVPLFQRAGVRALFCGHEHNFQHSSDGGIDYIVTGGAGEIRTGTPGASDLASAHTVSWAAKSHFLLVTIDGNEMTVRAIDEAGSDISRKTPIGADIAGPLVVTAA